MRKLISPGRLVFLAILVAAVLGIFFTRLYKLQIVEGNLNYELSTHSIMSTEPVIAARGNIMDRYGRLLVSNRNCNNLLIDEDELFYSGLDSSEINAAILQMCQIIRANGNEYNDELPITANTPWEFTSMSDTQLQLLNAWLDANGLSRDAGAVEVMAMMRTRYNIDGNYSAEEMRIIASVRYSVNVRYDINTSDYIFAQDVNINTITALMEADLPGFDVQVSYIREYNTSYAPHLLGYTGLMDAEDYKKYKDLGYPMNATIGKSGIEAAFEEYLHGVDGEARITRTNEGVITNTEYTKVPQPGNNIYITIDSELQGAAETALATYIENANAETESSNLRAQAEGKLSEVRELITGGALVAIDVNTGEPMCIASYPTYSLETFWDDVEELMHDKTTPLVNRALSGLYSPGSTWKPCMAAAALTEGYIDGETTINCTRIFDKYIDAVFEEV